MDRRPPGSPVPGILQARVLEGVAISFSRGSSSPRDQTHISCISCIGKWTLPLCHLGHPYWIRAGPKYESVLIRDREYTEIPNLRGLLVQWPSQNARTGARYLLWWPEGHWSSRRGSSSSRGAVLGSCQAAGLGRETGPGCTGVTATVQGTAWGCRTESTALTLAWITLCFAYLYLLV